MPPPVEDVSDEESGDIPYKDAPEEPTNGEKEAEEETDDDDEEEDEDVYIVEKIMKHDWLDDGTFKLLVKWKGYEAAKDQTWEEEEGLMDGASDIVNAYYKSIGGRPERPTEKAKPGRKRKSMGDNKSKTATPTTAPAAEPKKRRKAAPKETEEDTRTPEANGSWLPKGKNWDKEVTNVETIVRGEGEEGLVAFLEFNNGRKARVGIDVCYEKCPLKMLKFYESHLVFKDAKDMGDE